MGPRFGALLFLLFGVAVVIGVTAGKSASPVSSASTVAAQPTSPPLAVPGHVLIATNPDPNTVGEYVPQTYTARVGQPVIFVNTTDTDHTAVADNGAFSSPVLGRGQSFTWTPTRAGRYLYGCYIHPDMRGIVVVQP